MPNFFVLFRKLGPWTLSIAFCFGLATSGHADAGSATLSVYISDPSGAVVASAGVFVRNTETNQEQHSSTGKSGTSTFSFLKPGHYALFVTKDGFDKIAVNDITLNVGDDKFLNLVLKVGSSSQSVTVDGSGLTVNTTDASVSTVIDRNFVENMPLNGRSFQSLLTLAPGVTQVPPPSTIGPGNNVGNNGEIVVNGQRTEANYFTVDGVSANTGVAVQQFGGGAGISGGVAGETALGSTQSLVSIDDLQEFRATTSTYSAEYGRTPGGQFAFTTRSGTNKWHGSVFDYLRNDAMDANNWFNDYYSYPKEEERQNDFGGTLGGPVDLPHIYNGSDRTFFFFSYEGLRLDSPQAATPTAVPDTALRQNSTPALQPILNAFPLPNGGEDGLNDGFAYYIESVSYPATLNNTSIRIDHSFSDNFKVFGRYADTPSSTTSYSAAVKNLTGQTSHVLTFGSTNLFSAHQSNELRFNFTKSGGTSLQTSSDLGGATPFSLASLPGLGGANFPSTGSALTIVFDFGNYPEFNLQSIPASQKQFNITDTYTWTLARHSFKFGFDWRRLGTTLTPINPQEEAAYTDESQVLTNSPAVMVVQAQAPTDVEPVYLNFSSFFQDEWKATNRLALSLGIRWDIDPAPHSAQGPSPYNLTQVNDLATAQLAPAGTSLWKTDWVGFAPRIGLAYRAGEQADRATVLRAGFGLFYDMGNTQGSEGYDGVGIISDSVLTSAAFPLTSAQLAVPAPSVTTPYNGIVFAFDPHLKLPYSLEYNLALEQAMGKDQSLTLNYVGSGGRRLLTEFQLTPYTLGNRNFSPTGNLVLTQGRAASGYNSLQVKYQRALIQGFQALASYTWSHSIDDASNNFGLSQLLRANSDYDIRHNLQAAVTYNIALGISNTLAGALFNRWSLDMRLQAHSAPPVNIIEPERLDPLTGLYITYQPNRVSGQPVYLYGDQYPGRRVINYGAFAAAPTGTQGDIPRNFARAFDAVQLDVAVHRDFQLYERAHLQFRAEAFNITNHPNFGSVYNNLAYGAALFGHAYSTLNSSLGGLNPLFQTGGPRSLQLSLRVLF